MTTNLHSIDNNNSRLLSDKAYTEEIHKNDDGKYALNNPTGIKKPDYTLHNLMVFSTKITTMLSI